MGPKMGRFLRHLGNSLLHVSSPVTKGVTVCGADIRPMIIQPEECRSNCCSDHRFIIASSNGSKRGKARKGER